MKTNILRVQSGNITQIRAKGAALVNHEMHMNILRTYLHHGWPSVPRGPPERKPNGSWGAWTGRWQIL